MILQPDSAEFRAMLGAYMGCLLWTMPGTDGDDSPGDRFTLERFTRSARTVCGADCLEFLNRLQCAGLAPWVWQQSPRYALQGFGPEQFGHDLALSRNGHGAGFFDRDALELPSNPDRPESESLGETLQEIARAMGERDVYASGGWVHVS